MFPSARRITPQPMPLLASDIRTNKTNVTCDYVRHTAKGVVPANRQEFNVTPRVCGGLLRGHCIDVTFSLNASTTGPKTCCITLGVMYMCV